MTLLGRSSGEQAEQLRKSRVLLQQKVRNDWSYPNAPHVLPAYFNSTSTEPATSDSLAVSSAPQDARTHVNAHIKQNTTATTTQLENWSAAGWRERYYSDGEDSASEDDDNDSTPAYDTPDSVGTNLQDRKERRRRRRQQRFEDEMKENIGLAHWSAQRNTWTGAQSRESANWDPLASRPPPSQPQSPDDPSPATPTTTSTTATGAIPDTDLLIPVAHPLLPDNAIRNRITASSYSDIYTKIILQGRTPSIPINLSDITRALVHGWKEEGNWPPKPTPAEPSLVKRNGHPHFKGGLKQLGRVFGLKGQGVPVEKGAGQGQV